MWFTKVSLKNPVFATMMMLAFVVLGLFSYNRLPINQFPNIDLPVVVITTEYPGATPEVVESEVSKKIEEAVNTVAGINNLTSRSYDSLSVVVVEFQLQVNGPNAAQEIREKVSLIRPTLRVEVKEPKIQRFDPNSRAIWTLAVLPDPSEAERMNVQVPSAVALTNWADQVLKKRLQNVRGIGAVTLVGANKREINIYLQPSSLESLGVSADQVIAAVHDENQDLPLGVIRSKRDEAVLQIQSRMKTPADFANIIVAKKGNGLIRLSQVARIQDGPQELESLALFNGQRTLLASVQKSQDENTIDVIKGLNAKLQEIKKELPPGIKLVPIYDGSRMINVSVNNVRETLIDGAILTVMIVFLFLGSWRSTVITGLTIPISILGTFLFMQILGFSVNMVTLMALSLCVGLLIDDAIVVRENIVRHLHMGKSSMQAAMDGTQEIGLAVMATTFSIVAVFLPIGFMNGIIGKFFHEFGITIVVAVLISMFVSFTLDPMLSSVWHDPSVNTPLSEKTSTGAARFLWRILLQFENLTMSLTKHYTRMLDWSLRHPLKTLLGALAVFMVSLSLLPWVGTEFVPKADYSETYINFFTPMDSSIEITEDKTRQVQTILMQYPEVSYSLATINTGIANGKMYASIYARLKDRQQRTRSVDELSKIFRQRLQNVPGITVTQVGQVDPVGGNKQIELSIQGPDLNELAKLNQEALRKIRSIEGVVDLDSSLKPNKPIISVVLNKDAATTLGLSTLSIATQLRNLVAGQNTGNWRASDDQTYDVNVRLDPKQRDAAADLERLTFTLPSSAEGETRLAKLNQFAQVQLSSGPNQINRREMMREIGISTNVSGRSAGEVAKDIQAAMNTLQMPNGYRYQFAGSTKSMNESFGYAISALLMAIIFIYMILASQFKSFLQPLAIMSSLPLTLIGVVLALLLFRSAISLFSVIGIVMLMGLVTKNAILLIDFAIRARDPQHDDPSQAQPKALSRHEALLLAAQIRLRPILMTTLAMIFGMIPLAFSLTEGAEQRAPMGQAVIGGVITSSLLTLVVVPVVYCYLDDLSQWIKAKFHQDQH
jgi:HAE1 family hydrophobic/amphiphilic exporter-1